ncbi:MAG TPA: S8 family peptidase, partial [Actinomycetota bacterium]|nr:S8 family peptidase [Actinomycetota bacterium]
MSSTRFGAACLAGLLFSSALTGLGPAAALEPVAQLDTGARHVPGEVVVRYASGAEPAELRDQYDLDKVESLGPRQTELVRTEGSVAETVNELSADPGVVFAEPNYVYRASALPNDPFFPQLWGLHQPSDVDMDAPQAWDVTTGSPSVTVAVVDSGVAIDHPELAPNVWRNPGESGGGRETNGLDDDANGYVDDVQGWDWVGDDATPRDLHGHGTHVAATIAAAGDNSTGITGVAMNARVMALRALNSNGAGTTAELTSAFTYAARNGAKVVNVSLGGEGYSLSVLNAIAAAPDTLFVVAAGNGGVNNDLASSYPCNYPAPNIVCVAAMDSSDRLASFSNYGATTVDLAAPGVGILSVQPAFETKFYEDFTGGPGARWTTGGTNGTWGPEPDGSVSDSPGTTYLDGADHWIATAAPADLSGGIDCLLRYSLKLDVEQGNDVLMIEASRDGSTWETLSGWTGSTDGATDRMTEPLFDYDGAPSLHLRFRLVSNGSVTGDGATVDTVSVRCSSPTYTGSELLYAGGTSMAA